MDFEQMLKNMKALMQAEMWDGTEDFFGRRQ